MNTENRNTGINFPSKIEVEAPKTDSLIDALIKAFESFSKMLQAAFREIIDALQTLKQLPILVKNFQEEVTNQFTNMFTHQLETQMLSRQANIMAAQKKREIVDSRQKERLNQLPKDKQTIVDRYSNLLENVAKECQSQIRQIDSHAFDIVENIYPKQIQEKFSFDSMPTVEFFVAYADASNQSRMICLDESLARAKKEMKNFLARRSNFYNDLENIVANRKIKPGWYEIPFLVVEIEDINTRKTEHIVFLDPNVEKTYKASDSLLQQLKAIAIRQLASCIKVPLSADDKVAISNTMNTFGVPNTEKLRFESEKIEFILPKGAK